MKRAENTEETIHVCIVSESRASIITPIIDPGIPSHLLILAATESNKTEAQRLEPLAKTRGHNTQIVGLVDTQCLTTLKLAFLDIFEDASQHGAVWFNATSGTRFESLVAANVADTAGAAIYHVDPVNDELLWLNRDDAEPVPVQDKLKLHEYFSMFGSEFTNHHKGLQISKERRALGARWLASASEYGKALTTLNYLAYTARNEQFESVSFSDHMRKDSGLQALLADLEDINVLLVAGDKVHFHNEAARFYCNGGWLEEYVYSVITKLGSELAAIQDAAHSAEIARGTSKQKIKNELDVVALVNNKLHIIECKTKQFKTGAGSETLYKLDSLSELLGNVNGRAALVTFQPLSAAETLRAKELEIRLFGPEQLPQLATRLREWLVEA